VDALITEFTRQFHERGDKLQIDDLYPYRQMFHEWCRLFNHYDIIIGFATDPFLPMLSGRSYFAIEHGTLRTIPFDKNGQGRRTALAYNQAQHCFVTNFDCAGSAEVIAPGRFSLMNHPYDEDRGLNISGVTQLRDRLCKKLDADFLIFHPTRHDWVEGTGFADKKNEVLLLAFAELRARGWRVGLVVCEWGANVSHSKHLLRSRGCSRNVQWIKPLAITPFERMCRASDVVADQFKLGAFGGVVFKAMATGAPILTYLNEKQLKKQYAECPPVINCTTADEVILRVTALLNDRVLLKVMSEETRRWVKRFHGKKETINVQVDQFRLLHPAQKQSIFSNSP
jgi:glycosyltransferase involved in cell wall biosynthesis